MLATRVIVVLTLIEDGLYRTRGFKDPSSTSANYHPTTG